MERPEETVERCTEATMEETSGTAAAESVASMTVRGGTTWEQCR